MSTKARSASVLQKAMTGQFTFEASWMACLSATGSETTISLGSQLPLMFVFVKEPGMNLPRVRPGTHSLGELEDRLASERLSADGDDRTPDS